MSLLQYGFERKRIRDDLLQNDQVSDNEDNPNKDIKKPCIAKHSEHASYHFTDHLSIINIFLFETLKNSKKYITK